MDIDHRDHLAFNLEAALTAERARLVRLCAYLSGDGNAGRTGVYHLPALRELHGVKWQRTFAEDAYFPVVAEDTLYMGTASWA